MTYYFNNKKPDKKRAWTDKDKRFLMENYGKMSIDELAEHFGVNRTRIRNQAQRQGLTSRFI